MKRFTIHWKGLGRDSSFDWYFFLVCFALAIILVIAVDGYVYIALSSTEFAPSVPDATPSITLNRAALDSLAEKLRVKDATPHIVPQSVLRDPSL